MRMECSGDGDDKGRLAGGSLLADAIEPVELDREQERRGKQGTSRSCGRPEARAAPGESLIVTQKYKGSVGPSTFLVESLNSNQATGVLESSSGAVSIQNNWDVGFGMKGNARS